MNVKDYPSFTSNSVSGSEKYFLSNDIDKLSGMLGSRETAKGTECVSLNSSKVLVALVTSTFEITDISSGLLSSPSPDSLSYLMTIMLAIYSRSSAV